MAACDLRLQNATILYDLVKENGLQNTQVVLSGETPAANTRAASASARPQYQYPQYPYGYGYGRGQAVAPRGTTPARKPKFSLTSSRNRAVVACSGGSSRTRAICPAAAPRYYQRGYGY